MSVTRLSPAEGSSDWLRKRQQLNRLDSWLPSMSQSKRYSKGGASAGHSMPPLPLFPLLPSDLEWSDLLTALAAHGHGPRGGRQFAKLIGECLFHISE